MDNFWYLTEAIEAFYYGGTLTNDLYLNTNSIYQIDSLYGVFGMSIITNFTYYWNGVGITNIQDASLPSTITRDSEWDTMAEINAATTDTDAVLDTDIGVTVEAYDANITKDDEAETLTANWVKRRIRGPTMK